MSKYTKEDILKSAQENGVEFIRLQFTDVFGIMKNVAITSSQLEKALDNECMFDGSSIDGFVRINESDMYLHPDYDTWTIFPWRSTRTHRQLVLSARYIVPIIKHRSSVTQEMFFKRLWMKLLKWVTALM